MPRKNDDVKPEMCPTCGVPTRGHPKCPLCGAAVGQGHIETSLTYDGQQPMCSWCKAPRIGTGDGCSDLAAAILGQAERDYHLRDTSLRRSAQRSEVEEFLDSAWFVDLCDGLDLEPKRTAKAIREAWGLNHQITSSRNHST